MQALTTRICIAADHPSLPGHFPGQPIVPGVVLLDMICAAVQDTVGTDAHLAALPSVKFQRPALPGQVLEVQVEFSHPNERTVCARFHGTCELVPMLEGSMLFTKVAAHAD